MLEDRDTGIEAGGTHLVAPFRFTALGEKIADKAVRILREAEAIAEVARAEGQPLHGELRMGVIPTIAPFLLPAMLPRLRREWPSLKLYLREEASQAACEALHRGQLDCVLLANGTEANHTPVAKDGTEGEHGPAQPAHRPQEAPPPPPVPDSGAEPSTCVEPTPQTNVCGVETSMKNSAIFLASPDSVIIFTIPA